MPRKLASKRVFVPRKNRIVYVFNAKGEQVDSGLSKELDEKYELGGQMRVYIRTGKIKDRKFYFALTETIKIEDHVHSFNPEIRKKYEEAKEKKAAHKEYMKQFDINYNPNK